MNARASENYLAISRSSSASKSVEIFWAEIVSMFVSFEQKIECSPLLVTNIKKLPPFDQSQIIFTGIYRCCSSIYNIFK
jgi:hypothetical protein